MAKVYHNNHASLGDAPSISTSPSLSRKPKLLRKLLPKKLRFSKETDRTDVSTTRESIVSQRDPPTDFQEPDSLAVEELEISALNEKGNEFFSNGEFDAALRMYSEALKLLKDSSVTKELENGTDHQEGPKGMRRIRTARLLVNIGAVHIRRENYNEAITILEMALRWSQLVLVGSSYYHRACEIVADVHENSGLVLYKMKNFDESSAMYENALLSRRKCIDLMTAYFQKQKGPKTVEDGSKYREEVNAYKIELANTLFYLTLLKEKQGNIEGAILTCEESIQLQKDVYSVLKADLSTVNLFSTIGKLYCNESIQRYEDALPYFYEIHRIKCDLLGGTHIDVASALNNIAFIHLQLGDCDRCIEISDKSIEIASNGRGINPEVCVAWTNKADAQEKLGRNRIAIISYQKVLNLQSVCMSDNDIANAQIYEKMAQLYLTESDIKKAIVCLEKSIIVKRHALGDESDDLAMSYSKLGDCFEMRESYFNAIKCHTKALRIFKHNNDKEGAAVEHNKLGGILKASGEYHKAMEHYMASLWHSREAKLPSTNPIVADTIRNIACSQRI